MDFIRDGGILMSAGAAVASLVASLVAALVGLRVRAAVSELRAYVEMARREDAEAMRSWVEGRFEERAPSRIRSRRRAWTAPAPPQAS
jgi:hypothetical protein